MRSLKTSDLFGLSRIIKKMNIKDDIKALATDITGLSAEDKEKAEQTMQINLVMLFVENLGSAEQEIYKFLADLTEKTAKEIEDMKLSDFIEILKELFAQEDLGSFFSTALK